MKLLYVEDDETAASYVTRGLERQGFAVERAADALAGLERACRGGYDLIILDVMLPDRDGFELLRELRERGVDTPVLFLSARGDPSDRIRGLDLGADDYLRKPFAFGELVARIRAIDRRKRGGRQNDVLSAGDLVLDARRGSVERGGQRIELSRKQFAILEFLLRHQGRPVSREMILDAVWGYGFEAQSNLIDVHVNALRTRIDRDFPTKLIHTARGVGYVLEARSDG